MTDAIRFALPADAARLAAIYAPSVVDCETSFEIAPPDAAEMARRIAAGSAFFPWLVCEAEGNVVGYAYAGAHRAREAYRWSVDVSAYVDGSAHRRGVGRALYAALFELLALQGFKTAYAGITQSNAKSIAMHRALGFTDVGVFKHVGYKVGRWHDVGWYARDLAALGDGAPAELVAIGDVPADAVARFMAGTHR